MSYHVNRRWGDSDDDPNLLVGGREVGGKVIPADRRSRPGRHELISRGEVHSAGAAAELFVRRI
jgi:hypothetical protein